MLKPESSPLECFGLSWNKDDAMCQTCPYVAKCQENMGFRVERIAIGEAKFALVPEAFVRRHEEPEADRRDIEAIYCECYRQVFGVERTVGNIGGLCERLFKMAATAGVDLRTYVLINMFGYQQAYPEKAFTPGLLVDGRALYRVKVYADVCIEHFGTLNSTLLDVVTGGDLSEFDLAKRMLASEVKAGEWIVEYKLWHQGLPFQPMFDDLEPELDPGWLAVETHYEPILRQYSIREDQPTCKERLGSRHDAVMVYKRLKKRKHEAIAYFRARERIMPDAVKTILSRYGYDGNDFEVENKPFTDPLQFWNRLATAIQHLECLLFVNYHEGIYAQS